MTRRWTVRVRYRAYRRFEIVGETNAIVTFWTRFFARRYEGEVNRKPGYVAWTERS